MLRSYSWLALGLLGAIVFSCTVYGEGEAPSGDGEGGAPGPSGEETDTHGNGGKGEETDELTDSDDAESAGDGDGDTPSDGDGGSMGSGGDEAGTGGTPNIPEPELVVSGPDADARSVANFWKEQPLTLGGTAATVSVNTSQVKQDWYGFGGTFHERGWNVLGRLSAAHKAEVMALLFSPDQGIGLEWGRIPIGANEYSMERYHLSVAAGEFDITRDKQQDSGLIPYIKAALAVNAGIRFWASPWTPPLWAKKSSADNVMESGGYDKGIFDSTKQSAYVQFLVSWVDAYEEEGIPIDFVMPQNEPAWAANYPSCAFGPATSSSISQEVGTSDPVTLGPFTMALHAAFQATEHKTKVWLGTLSNDKYFNDYWGSLSDRSVIDGVGLQLDALPRVDTVSAAGKLVMASSHKAGNYPWLSNTATSYQDANRDNFLRAEAPNNYSYGEESWDEIKAWIDEGVNAYSGWHMVLDTKGLSLDQVRAWPQNTMIVIDESSGTYAVTPYYYVLRHVAQYVDMGAKVVTVTGDALAFKNPDGSVVVIAHNTAQTAVDTVISIDGTMYQVSIPGRGWATINKQPG